MLEDHAIWFGAGVIALCAIAWLSRFGDKQPGEPGQASDYGSHGTGRWASSREVEQHFVAEGPGAVLGRVAQTKGWRTVIHSFDQTHLNRFVLLIGPPGSGKTSRYTLPNLLHACRYDRRRSIVVPDPKGEAYRKTASLFLEDGFKVRVFNLINPRCSDRYNPLDYVHTAEDAARFAATIIANTQNPHGGGEAAFWKDSERMLIACILWYVKTVLLPADQHMATVLHLIGSFHANAEMMAAVFARLPADHEARRYYGVVAPLSDKTRDGVFVGASVRLQLWAGAEVTALTAASDFNLRELGRVPTVLYLIIPDSHATYKALTSLFFDQLFQELITLADSCKSGRLPVEVRLMLEEMANIGRIPDLEKRLATIRSRGIIVEMVLQTLGQLKALYGDAANTVLGCADTCCVLAANDQETAEYISRKLGQTTIRTHATSNTKAERGDSDGISLSYTQRPLMFADEVAGQGKGGLRHDELLLIQRGLPPARLQKYPYEEYPGADAIQPVEPAAYEAPPRAEVKLIDVASLPGAVPPAPAKKEPKPPKKPAQKIATPAPPWSPTDA